MEPIAEAVAMPDPQRAPKNMQEMIVTQPMAPSTKSMRAEAKFTILLAIPPVDIMVPASMKNGMHITVKEKIPL